MKLYVARNLHEGSQSLKIFTERPRLISNCFWQADSQALAIDEKEFKNVTFYNSPKEIEVKIK